MLNPATVETERAFLLEKGKRERNNGEVYRLLIEYQLSEEHRRTAREYAKEAINREPENNDAHSTFVQSSRGEWGIGYSTNHHKLIDYYKKFIAGHPNWRSGYMWLIDQLTGRRFTGRHDLIRMITNYITYYNNQRVQRNLGVLTPFEKKQLYFAA